MHQQHAASLILSIILCLVSAADILAQSNNLLPNPGLESIGACQGSQWPDTSCPDGFDGLRSPAVPIGTVDSGGDRAFVADFDQASGPSTQTGGLGMRIDGVVPGERYTFSAMIQPEAFKGRTRLFAYGRDQSPGGSPGQLGRVDVYGPSTQVADEAIDDDWRRVTLEIEVPDRATAMYFYATADLWWNCTAVPCGKVLFDYGGSDKSGISIWRSHRVTVRHSTIRDNAKNGLTNGRCLAKPSMDGPDAGTDVSFSECTAGYPPDAMQNYRFTSNEIHGNLMGIDAHASVGEVAGNRINHNTHGAKMIVGADRLWVHHNDVSAAAGNGLKINATYPFMNATADPSQHVYYANRIHDNGAWGVLVDRATEIYFLDNTFRGNGCVTLGSCPINSLRLTSGPPMGTSAYSCPGDEVAATAVSGVPAPESWHAWLDAPDPRCDLALVDQIFD